MLARPHQSKRWNCSCSDLSTNYDKCSAKKCQKFNSSLNQPACNWDCMIVFPLSTALLPSWQDTIQGVPYTGKYFLWPLEALFLWSSLYFCWSGFGGYLNISCVTTYTSGSVDFVTWRNKYSFSGVTIEDLRMINF